MTVTSAGTSTRRRGAQSMASDMTSDSIPISRNALLPLHEQVRTYLLEAIERGELAPGQLLLQEREYAVRFGISLAPVRQAILDLVKEGYLYRVRGRGTFVQEQKVEEKINILSSFAESMQAKGLHPDLRIIELHRIPAPVVAAPLHLANGEHVVSLRRVAAVQGEPIALLTAYLPARLVPGLETTDLYGKSLYRTLDERYGIVMARAESTIEVVHCGTDESVLLEVPRGTSLLKVEGLTYDVTDRLVEFSRVLYRADRFRFTIESFRRDDRVVHLIGSPISAEENKQT